MAKPYSMDLRERAVGRVVRGESVRATAQALSVSPSSVVKWSQRQRATGSAAPGRMGGNRRPKIVRKDSQIRLVRAALFGAGDFCRPPAALCGATVIPYIITDWRKR
jgi:transposase